MSESHEEITIRMLSDEDREEVALLSQRDTAPAPEGSLLGAIVGDRLVAAISLASGDVVADPFFPSEGARSMLQLRARQLNPKRSRLLPRRRRARGSLGAQPAGAGGRLLAVSRRA
jgi:hypothetical protein